MSSTSSAGPKSATPITDALTTISSAIAKTKTDLDAQIPLVRALETAGPTPPTPGQPSQDGAKASDPSTTLTTDDGTQWRLTGAPGAYTIQFAPKGTTTWAAAGNTAQVTGITKWKATCCQTSPNSSGLSQPGWWSGVMASPTAFGAWTAIPGDPSVPQPTPPPNPNPPSGAWAISNGQLLRGGKLFVPYGPALLDAMIGQVSPATLKQQFPGTTALNLAIGADNNGCLSAQPVANIIAWIDAAAAAGLAVMVSDYRPGQPQVRSGQDLTNALNWLAQLIRHYAGTQTLILTTENEVGGNLAEEHQKTYNMARSIDANIPIFMEAQNGNATSTGGLDASIYPSMHLIGWNVHAYPWEYNTGSQNQADYDNTARSFVQRFQSFSHNADGTMPVLMGEGGNSTSGNGTTPDDPKINGKYAVTQSILNVCTGKVGDFCGAFPWLRSWFNQIPPGRTDSDTLVWPDTGLVTPGYGAQCAGFTPPH